MALLAPVTRLRMSRWPIVNAIDALLSPVMALVQKNLGASSTGSADPDAYLTGTGGISTCAQTAFAQLHQLHPQLSEMYRDRKLWESMHADVATIDLKRRFAEVAQRQQQAVLQRAGGRFHALFAPWRWLLTIGAVLWFPIVQPILNVMLQQDVWNLSKETLRVVVGVLSVEHLLSCVTFLLLWLFILWVMLRWGTQRRVTRIIERWKRADSDDDLSLPQQVIQWTDEMLDPIHRRRERVEQILKQAELLRAQLNAAPASPAPALAGRV
jgi:hypothetical protein